MEKPFIQAELKGLHGVNGKDLKTFKPSGSFVLYVEAHIGPLDGHGEELFAITVCSPEWFAANMQKQVQTGRHHIFMQHYDYTALENFIRGYCATCRGTSWLEVALKLGRIGHWEFEDVTLPRLMDVQSTQRH